MERRDFTKIVLGASCAAAIPGCFSNKNQWPGNRMGGDENLFLNEEDFRRIRRTIDENEWAEKRFEVLKNTVYQSEDDYFENHWKGSWRQWSTGQYLKYIAIHYRLHAMKFKAINHRLILINPLKRTIKDLTIQIKKLEEELKKLIEENEPDLFIRLQSIPGIGKSTAMFMIVMSDGFKKFESAKQFTCYIGPLQCSSSA